MSQREFWMKVFIAAIGCGLDEDKAAHRADSAVNMLDRREFTDEMDHEEIIDGEASEVPSLPS
jgi:hypothetical protein